MVARTRAQTGAGDALIPAIPCESGVAETTGLAHNLRVRTLRSLFVFCVVCVLAGPSLRAAEAIRAYVVADEQSGHILAQQDANDKLQVGSLTKVATAIVALDWSRIDGHKLDQPVPITEGALAIGGANPVGFQAGDEVSLRDLLYAALLQSDNVAAQSLATFIGERLPAPGGEAGATPLVRFVAQMNALARNLVMERTRFLNPTGLDGAESPYSTAGDMARLTQHALTKPDFRFFVAQKERRISINRAGVPSEYLLRNTNELLGVQHIDGVKTGQTAKAGSCLIVTAAREPLVAQEGAKTLVTPRRLIVVVLGAQDRFRDAARLLTQGEGLYDQWMAQGAPENTKQKL